MRSRFSPTVAFAKDPDPGPSPAPHERPGRKTLTAAGRDGWRRLNLVARKYLSCQWRETGISFEWRDGSETGRDRIRTKSIDPTRQGRFLTLGVAVISLNAFAAWPVYGRGRRRVHVNTSGMFHITAPFFLTASHFSHGHFSFSQNIF